MNSWADHCVAQGLNAWHTMTLIDYAHVSIAIVLIGWAISRFK